MIPYPKRERTFPPRPGTQSTVPRRKLSRRDHLLHEFRWPPRMFSDHDCVRSHPHQAGESSDPVAGSVLRALGAGPDVSPTIEEARQTWLWSDLLPLPPRSCLDHGAPLGRPNPRPYERSRARRHRRRDALGGRKWRGESGAEELHPGIKGLAKVALL